MNSLFGGLKIRPMTQRLVEALLLDIPLTPAARVDFGVASEMHYRALREVLEVPMKECEGEDEEEMENHWASALRNRIVELEQALGNGGALNALVKQHAPHYAGRVTFQTDYDELLGRMTDKSLPSG